MGDVLAPRAEKHLSFNQQHGHGKEEHERLEGNGPTRMPAWADISEVTIQKYL